MDPAPSRELRPAPALPDARRPAALPLAVALTALLALGVAPAVAAEEKSPTPGSTPVPAEGGPVYDLTDSFGLLGETLTDMAEGWRDDLGIEVAMATIPRTDERLLLVANRWIETLRLGEDAPTGGMLVLLEPEGGRARIAVTYALEGALPDGLLSRLAVDQLAPYASYGKPAMAVHDILSLLEQILLEEVAAGRLELAPRLRARPALRERIEHLSGGAGAETTIPPAPEGGWKARVPPERRARYAPSEDPLESFEAYVRTLEDRVGDPELALFTPGSRLNRLYSPLAPYEADERARAFRRAGPYAVVVEGNRAVVRSEEPAADIHPVLLHRIGGLWRVDLVEVWKNVFFPKGKAHLYNRQNPYRFGLEGMPAIAASGRELAEDDGVAPLSVDAHAEVARLEARLERGEDAETHLALAEILFRNAFLWELSLRHYRAAVRLAPEDPQILSTAADRALYLHLYEGAIPWLERLGPEGYERLAWAHRSAGRRDQAIAYYTRVVEKDPFAMRARRALTALKGEKGGG